MAKITVIVDDGEPQVFETPHVTKESDSNTKRHAIGLAIYRLAMMKPDEFILISTTPKGEVTYVIESDDKASLIERFWRVGDPDWFSRLGIY